MSKPVLFQDGNRYVFVTGECPQGFKGTLFVAWEGETPGNLQETVKAADQLQALVSSRVELTSISAEWRAALSKATGLSLPEPEPEPKPEMPEPKMPEPKIPDLYLQMGPLCVTWVWAFGIATIVAILLGIIK